MTDIIKDFNVSTMREFNNVVFHTGMNMTRMMQDPERTQKFNQYKKALIASPMFNSVVRAAKLKAEKSDFGSYNQSRELSERTKRYVENFDRKIDLGVALVTTFAILKNEATGQADPAKIFATASSDENIVETFARATVRYSNFMLSTKKTPEMDSFNPIKDEILLLHATQRARSVQPFKPDYIV